MKLSKKQELFCIEYTVDLNATQAAIRAGYSKKCARQVGANNMATAPKNHQKIQCNQ